MNNSTKTSAAAATEPQPIAANVEEIKDKVETADLTRIKKYKLSRPVTVADKTYEVLSLDFDKLTGEDMEHAAMLPGAIPGDGSTSEYSKTYLMAIAARAAGITIHEIRKFPIADTTGLTMVAYGFLMRGLSESIKQ